jgi:hypothetical protein
MPWRNMGEWRYSSTILSLGTRWRWVVSFMLQPLQPWGKSSRFLLDRRLGEPQSWAGRYAVEKNLTPARNQTPATLPLVLSPQSVIKLLDYSYHFNTTHLAYHYSIQWAYTRHPTDKHIEYYKHQEWKKKISIPHYTFRFLTILNDTMILILTTWCN